MDSEFAYPVKHDKKITDEILKTHYLSKIHLTGIGPDTPDGEKDNRYPMHWRITVECRPVEIVEQTKVSKTQTKGESSKATNSKSKATDSKSKATESKKNKTHDSTKSKEESKSIFIAIETEVRTADFLKNKKKWDVPAEMITLLKAYAHSRYSPEETRFTFTLSKDKRGTTAKQLFEWFEYKGHLRYKPAANGYGCFFHAKRLLTDMKNDGWFDSHSKTNEKNFATLDSYKKGTKIGAECYIEYAIGTFY